MKKLLAVLIALMMVLSLCSACTSSVETETTAPEATDSTTSTEPESTPATVEETAAGANCTVSEDANIVVVHYSDVSTMMPPDQTTVAEAFPSTLVYECPLMTDSDNNFIWTLATGCDVSDDNLAYTFHLRDGITFSDGAAWNAEAMKKNFDLWIDSSYAFKGVSSYSCIDHSEVTDDMTCVVYLNTPDAAFLTKLANNGYMVSPKLIDEGPDAWTSTSAGTGQYIMTEYRSGESMTFELNRDWWGYDADICGGTPLADSNCGFNTITVKPVSEEATRIAMLLAGEADIIMSVQAKNTDTIENAGDQIITRISTMVAYMNFNCQKECMKDVRVRHALAMAIDVDSLNQVVYGGAYVRARSFSADSINYFVPQELYPYDPEGAKELLKEAGYGDGLDLILWSENDNTDVARAEFIQQQLGEIGVNVEVKCMEGGALTAAFEAVDPADLEWDLYVRGYSASNGDASLALGRFASDKFYPIGANYCFWSNEEFDKYIAEGASTTDPAARLAAYTAAQKIIWEELPAYPMLVSTSRAGLSNNVENVGFKNNGNVDLRWAVYTGN